MLVTNNANMKVKQIRLLQIIKMEKNIHLERKRRIFQLSSPIDFSKFVDSFSQIRRQCSFKTGGKEQKASQIGPRNFSWGACNSFCPFYRKLTSTTLH